MGGECVTDCTVTVRSGGIDMTYTIEIFGSDKRVLGKRTLTETRKQACAIAKKNPGKRVAIYDPSKMYSHPVEDITYYLNERTITGDLLNGYHIVQWDKHRIRRVSPKNGELLDYNKEWKWI